MTPTDHDALREGLARWFLAEAMDPQGRSPEGDADAVLALPELAPLLAKAESAERVAAVLDKYEPRFRTDALRPELQALDERVAFACHEAIDGREGERRLAERAGITLGVTAADDPAVLVDGLRAATARADRLAAENAALRAGLDQAEACLSIVEPRTDRAEYMRILGVIRAALRTDPPAGSDAPVLFRKLSGEEKQERANALADAYERESEARKRLAADFWRDLEEDDMPRGFR